MRLLRLPLTPFSSFNASGIPEIEAKNREQIAQAEQDLREKRQPLTGSRMRRAFGAARQWYQDEKVMRGAEIDIRKRNSDEYQVKADRELADRFAREAEEMRLDIEHALQLVPKRVIETYPLPEERRRR